MEWPILQGIFTNSDSDFRTAFPRNMVPVLESNGVSEGYLRPAEGLELVNTGPGKDRGGINWNGRHFRVMGASLVEINSLGAYIIRGGVEGSTEPVSMDYSFDYLAIASNDKLWLYDGGSTVTQVTDTDLGVVKDVVFVDGYFLSTDGENLVVNDLVDTDLDPDTPPIPYPWSYSPLKYGSSEVDPDPVVAVLKLRNEIYAVNRHTIEIFQNVGGQGFPFQRINGAQIRRGSIGLKTCCVFTDEFIAFLGGGRNESNAIWLGANGQSKKISTRTIDQILYSYGEDQLKDAILEERIDRNHKFLYVHLPDQTLVYDFFASEKSQFPVWHVLTSGLDETGRYKARFFVYVYDKWYAGDPTSFRICTFSDSISSHYGEETAWEFSTPLFYNESRALLINELELVTLSGRAALGDDPEISTEYSHDGMTWGQPQYIKLGKVGERLKRVSWFRQGILKQFRTHRFRGTSKCHASFSRLEVKAEPLKYG